MHLMNGTRPFLCSYIKYAAMGNSNSRASLSRVPMSKTQLSLLLMRKSRVFPFARIVGICKMSVAELVKRREEHEGPRQRFSLSSVESHLN